MVGVAKPFSGVINMDIKDSKPDWGTDRSREMARPAVRYLLATASVAMRHIMATPPTAV